LRIVIRNIEILIANCNTYYILKAEMLSFAVVPSSIREQWRKDERNIETKLNLERTLFSDLDIISGNPIKQLAQFEESKQMQISGGCRFRRVC
jgi:hypothetical protein